MLNFACDYLDAAHPKVLEALVRENFVKTGCYGEDDVFSDAARAKIREAAAAPEAEVWFLAGGTQTNMVVISTMLENWQGVFAAKTGHVAVHEAGAIEASGHKVLELPSVNGKIVPADLEAAFRSWEGDGNRWHMVQPGLVYVTQSTECGTLYSLAELEAISEITHRHGARLFLDGARLFYGLAAAGNDVSLADIARLTDAFYIGGTKCGLLFGEAVVFPKAGTVPHFFTQMKQKGALLAKGKVLGIQFDTLMADGLGLTIAAHADREADRIRAALRGKGYTTLYDNPTNQIFVQFTNEEAERLGREVVMSFWERTDADHVVLRIATSWATDPKDTDELIALL
ncbi:low specificity L-threonine aldolase [Sutterella sp.]|uniref:threonine aldolase family protein n=1 Tax=Sutterella sp. TaxID=1981025 RepID=UPI0026E0556E|nr:aminotransferase class I/II-fold pyridoxal phosphate-dependent enzyme [Sutterella sp.]MDO5532082.1 aminotransferase class I/II-fold pyridoxal phosphate-dependent enzyme [Sutterella sp.]